jgi:hypothetical protein
VSLPHQVSELYFLLDARGALIVYQENETSWVGVLAFSSEARAREFADASKLEVCEIAAIAAADRDALSALVRQVKTRAVRNLLLDLDYRSGGCTMVEFEGDGLGPSRQWQFTPKRGAESSR